MKKNKNFTPEAVTLTLYGKSAEKFGVTWQTGDAGEPVVFVTDPDDKKFAAARQIPAETSPSIGTVKNSAVIDGLLPDRDYLWRVGDKSGIYSAPSIMHTPKNSTDSAELLVFADTQDDENHGVWWNKAFERALEEFPNADFTAHAGDIVQFSGNPVRWARMLGNTRKYTRSIPMIPACGNHDYWYCYLFGHDSTFYKHFTLDLPPQDTAHGAYYSLDEGPIHFTVMSSGDVMATDGARYLPEQYEWVKRDLTESDKPWKIVIVHNPMYSPGKYGSRYPIDTVCRTTRADLGELFVSAGVDLVISGHDHVFSRTYPMSADAVPLVDTLVERELIGEKEYDLYLDPAGPIHMLPGCAGEQNREIEEDMTPELTQYFREMVSMPKNAVSYASVRVEGDRMAISFRMFDVHSGESVCESNFGIKKSSLKK